VHAFFLQAPRSLGDPDLRHVNATIGHAVSRDLRSWRVLPPALDAPGPPGEFDSLATWTGSVVRGGEGRWHMLYSGIARETGGREQRIGAAVSDDLVRWERRGEVLAADPRWYETSSASDSSPAEVHWRDPWVYADGRGGWAMLITARAATGPVATRGVVGRATSPDLATWEAGPPVSEPGDLFQLEVPQLIHAGGRWRILFSSMEREQGVHYLSADSPEGPFTLARGDFLFGGGHWYAGRAIERAGRWWLLAWQMRDEAGAFAGTLSDPLPLTFPGPA
jgi:beta-fructofuranosidase